jgi:hypothetical protein
MTLQLHKPDGRGGLVPTNPRDDPRDWRRDLVSRRWRPARLGNSEMNPTSTRMAVLFWVGLAALTFVLLMAGYGSNFWK